MKQFSFLFACVLYCSVCIAQDDHSGHSHYENTKQALMEQTRFVFGVKLEKLNDKEISQLAKNLVSVADIVAKTPELEKHIEHVWSNKDPKLRIDHLSKCHCVIQIFELFLLIQNYKITFQLSNLVQFMLLKIHTSVLIQTLIFSL